MDPTIGSFHTRPDVCKSLNTQRYQAFARFQIVRLPINASLPRQGLTEYQHLRFNRPPTNMSDIRPLLFFLLAIPLIPCVF